jgi:hypothetical protein
MFPLRIERVLFKGDVKREHVILAVENTCNLGDYALFHSAFKDGGREKDNERYFVSKRVAHTFWFPDWIAHGGSFVVVNSGVRPEITALAKVEGETSNALDLPRHAGTFTNQLGSISHVFYWGLEEAVWGEAGACAVLARISGVVARPLLKFDEVVEEAA